MTLVADWNMLQKLPYSKAEKFKLVPDCAVCSSPCRRTSDYNMENIWNAPENIRSLKLLILFGVRNMAAYAHHAMILGYTDDEINCFFVKALFTIGEDWDTENLLPVTMKVVLFKKTKLLLFILARSKRKIFRFNR